MDSEIALFLALDGLTNGAIYVLMALGIVMVFNVTRVAFVPFGDLAAYAALTFAALQGGTLPGTVWLVALLAAFAFIMEAVGLIRRGDGRRLPKAILYYLVLPLAPALVAWTLAGRALPLWGEITLTFGLILPIGPLIYRVAFRPIANASVLVLLMVAVAVHLVITGLALLFFGPEGVRAQGFVAGGFEIFGTPITAQNLLVVVSAVVFSVAAYVFFTVTVLGKALRATAVNRVGARLVGIRTTTAGAMAFLLASFIATISGILVGPTTTIYYDTGFMIGLKGFVGAVMGGFVSYPPAAIGALLIGMIESFAAFEASALKEVIVFTAIIPIVMWRWVTTSLSHDDDADEEEVTA